MTFEECLHSLPNTTTPDALLEALSQAEISSFHEYLLFGTSEKKALFLQNLTFLAEEDVWTPEELVDYQLVAQTIDNDYILASNSQVLVIPSHLYRDDSETYDLTITTFFEQYIEGALPSNILAANS